MMFRILSLTVALLIITACKTTKKTSQKNDDVVIHLDTISVRANEPLKQEIYRASNTRQNDIIHTRLEVNFDWNLCRMNGKATLVVKPYFYRTNRLYLNARGMEIKKLQIVEVDAEGARKKIASQPIDNTYPNEGTAAGLAGSMGSSPYVYENDSIKINLGRMFSANETYSVIIDYVAKPNELKSSGGSSAIIDDKGLYFINPTGENTFKMPQIWTQGETQASSVWFPTIDSPNEKMTQEILMTVEDKYTTLSNGLLVSSVKQANGTRVDHWKQDQPHSPYLAMMAVGQFKKVIDAPWNGKEVSYYVEPQYEEFAKGIFGDTKEMIEFYSNKLGVAYPWPKYAQIVARDYVSGAMENTSATLHGDFMVYQTAREMLDGKKGNPVIAHELFHQWFGDLVTAESWSNLPLNESFATYGEYLWEEYKNGRDAADHHHWQSKQGYLASTKEVDLIRFNYTDKEDMFDAFSYNKGGQVLHMLRKTVGDEAFFASLKNYLETNKYKSAEIHNLRLAFEETTGRDLNWFFNQWFLTKGRPKLKVTTAQNTTADSIKITVEQMQDLSSSLVYVLPLRIDIYLGGGAVQKQVTIDQQKQVFTFPSKHLPDLINFDADRQLLADIEYSKTVQQYLHQYKYAPLFEDRLESLRELENKMKEPGVWEMFKEAAQNDKFHAIRNYAISRLDKAGTDAAGEVKGVLMQIYMNDKNTVTRSKALAALNKMNAGTNEMEDLNVSALSEQSYAISGEALEALTKSNPAKAMEKSVVLQNESGKSILFPIANLYAAHGGDHQIHFFHNALRYINGFELMSFASSYAKTARQCSIPANVLLAANDLEMLGKGANKYIKFSTVKGLKDLLSTWESKESTAQAKFDDAKKENKNIAELEKELKATKETKATLAEIYNRSK